MPRAKRLPRVPSITPGKTEAGLSRRLIFREIRRMSLNVESLERYGEGMLTEHLRDILKQAQGGDRMAALAGLMKIVHFLDSADTPLPSYVRKYLSNCFAKILVKGLDANIAFNLKRSARPRRWEHLHRIVAADIVLQLVEQGLRVTEATADAADVIQEHARSGRCTYIWWEFRDNPVDASTLQRWYYEHKNEVIARRLAAGIAG
jgi:hypothetical protein